MSRSLKLWDDVANQKYNEWIAAKCPSEMIEKYKNDPNYSLALRALEASHPVLEKFGSGMIGEAGDIPCFIGFSVDTQGNAQSMLVVADEDDEEDMNHLQCSGTEGKELAAAFICCFPEANFLYQKTPTEPPRRMILITKDQDGKMSIHKHCMTLAILKEFYESGQKEFFVGCT
jgi:hypothetical protein